MIYVGSFKIKPDLYIHLNVNITS